MNYLLYNSDLVALSNNFAEAVTNQVRSLDPGDNLNDTMLPGTAYHQESFINVRWGWLILPLAETLFTIDCLTCGLDYADEKTTSAERLNDSFAHSWHPRMVRSRTENT
ncbi:hypothetical protein F5B20DRAFT_534390 [Whalleya microplaca]|nr:hypothetical protein F5B20DRAFT_534390 [Whalleya microplaca]